MTPNLYGMQVSQDVMDRNPELNVKTEGGPANPSKYHNARTESQGMRFRRSLYPSHARSQAGRHKSICALALHDVSGGAGILPEKWPQPMGDYCGYAGGLSPENIVEQLELIKSRIRNKDGSLYSIWTVRHGDSLVDVNRRQKENENRHQTHRKRELHPYP